MDITRGKPQSSVVLIAWGNANPRRPAELSWTFLTMKVSLEMHKILFSLFVFGVIFSLSASATIVHHCDYGTHTAEAHENHGINHDYPAGYECNNHNENTYDGECEFTSAFYWTFSQCSSDFSNGTQTCQVQGTIDCAGGDKSYSFTCTGSMSYGTFAFADRQHAGCDSSQGTKECTCSSPGNYCGN